LKVLKRSSIAGSESARRDVAALRSAGFQLDLSWRWYRSLESTRADASVTEVTVDPDCTHRACSIIFNIFGMLHRFAFALQVTRRPTNGVVTCLGWYVASGPAAAIDCRGPSCPPA